PWRVTQGMEVQGFLAAPPGDARAPRMGLPPGAWGAGTLETVQWRGGTLETVQGGGLRLANLPRVLPENLAHLRAAYGDALLALAVFGALVALGGRRILLLAALPYALLALIFFSCWSKPDPRYLSGVHLLLPLLVVEGALGTPALVRRLARAGRPAGAWGLARRGRHHHRGRRPPRREHRVLQRRGARALPDRPRALGPHGRRRGRAPRARGNAPVPPAPEGAPRPRPAARGARPPLRGRAGRRHPRAARGRLLRRRAIPPRGHPHAAPSPRPARLRRALTRSGPGTRRLSGNHGGCGERYGAASGVLAPPS